MTQINLNPAQREQVYALIERRLSKLDDDVLIDLEQLTRNPQRLQGFVPKSKTTPRTQGGAQLDRSASSTKDSAQSSMGRRQLLRDFISVAMLGVVGTGGYLVGAFNQQQDIDQYKILESVVESAIDQLDSKVSTLTKEAQTIVSEMEMVHDTAVHYHDSFHEIRNTLSNWWDKTKIAKIDYDQMQLVEGGARFIADLLSLLASLPQMTIKLLDSAVQLELGNLDDLQAALKAASNLLPHLDSAFQQADVLHMKISPWFFGENQTDIKNQLLEKLVYEFSNQIVDLGAEVQELESAWRQGFVQPINDTRQLIKQT